MPTKGPKAAPPAAKIRSRITRHAIVPAKSLKPNPLNFRIHPDTQKAAVGEAIDTLGWIEEIIVNERTGNIVNGHLRAERAASRDEEVPVSYVDLTEEEERLALATLDPLSALAVEDAGRSRELLDSLTVDPESILGNFLETNLQEAALISLTRDDPKSSIPDERSKRLSGKRTNICLVIPLKDLGLAERAIAATGLQNRGEACQVIFRRYLDAVGQFDVPS